MLEEGITGVLRETYKVEPVLKKEKYQASFAIKEIKMQYMLLRVDQETTCI